MSRKRVHQQVKAILEANSLPWAGTSTGGMYLRFASSAVAIEMTDWGAQTLLEISSDVLAGVEGKTKAILREVNTLNKTSHFGRWVYYEESQTISVEYCLLGDHLQEDELMTCLAALARRADHHDDVLQRKLGGSRAHED